MRRLTSKLLAAGMMVAVLALAATSAWADNSTTSVQAPLAEVTLPGDVYTESAPAVASSQASGQTDPSVLRAHDPDEAGLLLFGGADAAGYIFKDSDEPDGPALNFENIAGSGTHLGALTSVTPLALPFPFQFYNQGYSSIEVSPNGFISFLAGTPYGQGGQPIPTAGAPNAIVAALWGNWAPLGAQGTVRPNVYYQTMGVAPNRRFILQWDGDAGQATSSTGCSWNLGNSSDTRVQLKLFESSNVIEVQYGYRDSTICRGYASTGGIENETGVIGLQYQHFPIGAPLSPGWPDFPHAVRYEQTIADLSINIDSPQCQPRSYGPDAGDAPSSIDGVTQPNGVVIAGEEIIYTVGVYNRGPDTALDVTATVTLPVGVMYLADTDSCVSDDGTPEVLTCSLGDMDRYAFEEFEIKGLIDAALVRLEGDGTTVITAEASVSSSNLDTDLDNNIDDCDCFVQDLADLSVIKMSKPDDEVWHGEPFYYTIYVDNTGPSWARGVYITDDMISDDEFEIVQVIDDPARNDSCTVVDAPDPQTGQLIKCELREPLEPFGYAGGTGRWRIQVEANIEYNDEPTDINNTVRVYTGPNDHDGLQEPWENGTPDPDESNNVAIDSISVLDTTDLELTKRADLDIVTAGNLLRYSIRVTNTGHAGGGSTATNVRYYDNLPAEVELVAVTASDGDCVAGTPGDPTDPTMCIIDELDVGESATMQVYVRVLPDVPIDPVLPCDQPSPFCRGRIFNDAWVESDVVDPDLSNNLEDWSVDVNFVADLQVFKGDQPDSVAAGEELTYNITVNNAGPSTARDVFIRDTLPDEVELISAVVLDRPGSCEVNAANQLICSLGDIEPGTPVLGQVQILVTVRVLPDVPAGIITNNVTVFTFQTLDPDDSNNTADEETSVSNVAEVTLQKTAVSSSVTPPGFDRDGTIVAVPGGTLTYEFEVRNEGPSTAYDVTVTDPLVAGLIYRYSTSAVCELTPSVSCNIGTLEPWDAYTFEVIVEVDAAYGDPTIENTATVEWALANGNLGGTDQDTEIVPVNQVADLRVTKFGKPDGEVRAGENLTYTIMVDNLGPSFAAGVTITDEIRSDGIFEILGVNADVGNNFPNQVSCYLPDPLVRDQRATITCTLEPPLGVFGPGEIGRWGIEVILTADEGVDINNCASVSSEALDPDFSNNHTCTMHEVTEVADLSVTKTAVGQVVVDGCPWGTDLADDEVNAGLLLNYQMIVTNNGPSTAENVTLIDRLPPGIVVIAYDAPDGGDCDTGTPGEPLDKLTCGLNTLAPGESATVNVTSRVDADVPDGTILENDVFVYSDQFDDDNSNNYTSNLTTVHADADLRVAKSDNPDPVVAGELLTYKVVIANDGPSDAQNVVVVDYLPDEVEFLWADEAPESPILAACGYDPIDLEITCNLGTVPAGTVAYIDIHVMVKPDAVPSGQASSYFTNDVTVSSLTDDPCLDNNEWEEDTDVNRASDVINAKIDDPDPVVAGTEVKYTISFGNEGASTATNVTVYDQLPVGLTFVRCEPADPANLVQCTDMGGGLIAVNSITQAGVEVWNDTFGTDENDLDPGENYWFQLVAFVDEGYVLDGLGDTGVGEACYELAMAADWPHFAHDQVTVSSLTSQFEIDECTKVVAEADLEVEKTDIFGDFTTCDPVEPGGDVTYVITVRNHGPSDAAEVWLLDWLPAGHVIVDPAEVEVEIVGGAGEVGEIRDDGFIGVLIGDGEEEAFGRMDDGDEIVVIIRTRVRLDAACGDEFANLAVVKTAPNDGVWPPLPGFSSSRTPTPDPDLTNNEAMEYTLVECPAVDVIKTVSFDGSCPGKDLPSVWNQTGQPVTFCFEVTNAGTTYLDEIYLEDKLTARTIGEVVIFTDTITSGLDPLVPVAPGETVYRQVTIPHLLMDRHQECGKVTDTVTVTANPVNSGRTDYECLNDVTASDTALIEVPCAGVDWRIQLPILGGT